MLEPKEQQIYFSKLPNFVSSASVRPINGAMGYSLRISFITHSKYFMSFISPVVGDLSESWKIDSISLATFSW